ncbi:MAG: 30S ribosomal protein S3 [Chloroflexi bacterium]|nr:30S ribosomal protein S3 [Chloroflexota bacterium]
MGRKVNPVGFRLGMVEDHRSRWFAEGDEYTELLVEDRAIRQLVQGSLPEAGIAKVEIERFPPNQVRVTVHSAKPGVIIGRKGATVNALRADLQKLTNKKVKLDIAEIEHPEVDAYLIAVSIAEQLQRRISHKRAMKQAMLRALRSGAQGCMIRCGGRLAGAEMARVETVREGRVPRHTLRAEIDYARSEALTTFGRIGIKVWIYKGERLPGAE